MWSISACTFILDFLIAIWEQDRRVMRFWPEMHLLLSVSAIPTYGGVVPIVNSLTHVTVWGALACLVSGIITWAVLPL